MTSFERPTIDWAALSPELILLGGAALCLIIALFLPWGWRRPLLRSGRRALAGRGGAAAIVLFTMDEGTARNRLRRVAPRPPRRVRADPDRGLGTPRRRGQLRLGAGRADARGEYYALLLSASAGMAFFVAASNLMTLFLGLEWFSISPTSPSSRWRTCLRSRRAWKYLIVGELRLGDPPLRERIHLRGDGLLGFAETAAGADEADHPFLVAGLSSSSSASRSRPRQRPSTCGRLTSTRARRRPSRPSCQPRRKSRRSS